MAESKLEEVKTQLQRARTALANVRNQSEAIVGRATLGAMAMGGGVVAAALDMKMPTVPGTQFPMKVAVGGIAAALGLADGAGKFSDQLASFGWGLLTTQAYDSTKKALAA